MMVCEAFCSVISTIMVAMGLHAIPTASLHSQDDIVVKNHGAIFETKKLCCVCSVQDIALTLHTLHCPYT